MKKLILFFMVAAMFGACNTTTNSNDADQKSAVVEISSISVDSFLVVAGNYVGQELTVKGTADHVCKHGGKRVKIFSSCPSKSIHGEAGETMGNFNAEIEGSDILLTGIVGESKIDLAYVEEYEAKIKAAIAKSAEETDMEHKEGVDHHAKLDEVAKWKEEIAASEKGYLSTYFLEVSSYELCAETTEAPCCSKENDSTEVEAVVENGVAEKPCSEAKTCSEAKDEAKPCPHSN